jgi:hypothetical protein
MEQNPFTRRFHFYFNLAMVLIYAVAGILLLFVVKFDSIPKTNITVIGCVLLLYSAYRGYKVFKEKKAADENTNPDVEEK